MSIKKQISEGLDEHFEKNVKPLLSEQNQKIETLTSKFDELLEEIKKERHAQNASSSETNELLKQLVSKLG